MGIANNAVNPENGGNVRRNKNQENQLQVACRQCGRRFCNFINHLWFCNPTPMDDEASRPPPLLAVNRVGNNLNGADDAVAKKRFFWGNTPGNQAVKECYEKIVFWHKNLYMLPTGSSGKDFTREITRLINEWLIESPIKK